MPSLTSTAQQIDRRVKGILRSVDIDSLSKTERHHVKQLQLACNEVKLDVRDYEYADTRETQLKWLKIARNNIHVMEALLLKLDDIFGPADIAELSAQLQMLQSNME